MQDFQHEKQQEHDDGNASDKAQFLAGHGEDIVAVLEGDHVASDPGPLAKALAAKAAAADGDAPLPLLEAVGHADVRVGVQVEYRHKADLLIVLEHILPHDGQGHHHKARQYGEVPKGHPGGKAHKQEHGEKPDGSARVPLELAQGHGHAGVQAEQKYLREIADGPFLFDDVQMLCVCYHERYLHKLAGLEGAAANIYPGPGVNAAGAHDALAEKISVYHKKDGEARDDMPEAGDVRIVDGAYDYGP